MAGNSGKDIREVIKKEEIPDTSEPDTVGERELDKLKIEQASNKRDERLRNNMLNIALVFLWILGSILLATIIIFAWHKLAPDRWYFLCKKQIESIQTFLLSSALTAFLSSLGRGLLEKYKLKQN